VIGEKGLSPELVDLMRKILVPQGNRISLKDIAGHPWMGMKSSEKKLNINFDKIRSYSKFSKVTMMVGSSRCWCSITSRLNCRRRR